MFTDWSEDLATQIKEIDNCNKELFRRIDSLIKASKYGKVREELPQMMKFLNKYATEHLKNEEKYMMEYGYLKNIHHGIMHSFFIKSFHRLNNEYEKEGPKNITFILELINLLTNWLISHVNRDDKEMADFIRNKVKNAPSKIQI